MSNKLNQEEIEAQKERIRNDLRRVRYKIWVFPESHNWKKVRVCYPAYSSYDDSWEVFELLPSLLKSLGYDRHMRSSATKDGLFYCNLGKDEFVMSLSYFLFERQHDALECLHAQNYESPEAVNGVIHYKNGATFDVNASYVLSRRN
jgi:hypothetical protein